VFIAFDFVPSTVATVKERAFGHKTVAWTSAFSSALLKVTSSPSATGKGLTTFSSGRNSEFGCDEKVSDTVEQ